MSGIWRVDLHFHVVGSLTTGAGNEVIPILIADNGTALRCTVAHGIWEINSLKEMLHFLVQSCTANDDLIHLATEGFKHFLTYHLAYLLGDDGHLQKQAHAVVLNFREYLLTDNLLDDKWHGDDNDRFNLGQCLCNDGGRWYTIKIVDMTAV